jgi:type I restriction enzyme M protein
MRSANGNNDSSSPQNIEPSKCKTGYIIDYISGQEVKATPEEIEAIQVFSQRLVEDYGYDKKQIQVHPQFRVRKRPSDEEKSYPVDIAVFKSSQHEESKLHLLVECKQKNRQDGLAQLKLYLEMSPATIGAWFNGEAHAYILKIRHDDGTIEWRDIPNIPRKGQRIEDIGLFKRKDLKKPSNLKAVFRDIRNRLAGMTLVLPEMRHLLKKLLVYYFAKFSMNRKEGQTTLLNFGLELGKMPLLFRKEYFYYLKKLRLQLLKMCFHQATPLSWTLIVCFT